MSSDLSNKPPTNSANSGADPENPAVNVIRSKINSLYAHEPNVSQEIEEVSEASDAHEHLSKHQKYMHDLSTSGKSLAEIQTAWHNYYVNLPDSEKHKVWQEFYEANAQQATSNPATSTSTTESNNEEARTDGPDDSKKATVADVKKRIARTAKRRGRLPKNHHVRSLLFGFSMGALVLLFLLFGFFNERFITPFITPSRSVSSTPIIIDPKNTAVGKESKIIIPKINVEIPVVYDTPYGNDHVVNEANIQKELEKGVVHYPSTPKPGELGNAAIVGHSSNNIFNQGKYKFAFVLLSRLENGDTFYIHRDGVRYAYKVYSKKIVEPTDVSVLGSTSKTATATLITCDPPGTSLRRLIIVGEQVSPSPSKNAKSTATVPTPASEAIIPGNAPTLWHRLTSWLFD